MILYLKIVDLLHKGVKNGTRYNPGTGLSVRIFCGKENCEPGHSFGPAVRPHYLLHVVLDGKGFYRKNGVTYSLHKGDAFLIPPMESTYYEADQEDPWTYAWVGFDGKNCKQTLRQTVFFIPLSF